MDSPDMKCLATFLLLISSIFSFGQEAKAYTVKKVDALESFYGEYYIDESRLLTFDEIKDKEFKQGNYPINTQATYWFKFKLQIEQEANFLLIYIDICDEADVFVPYSNGYKASKTGILTKGSRISDNITQASTVTINPDSVNLNQPFYLKIKPISDWGILGLDNPISVVHTNDNLFLVKYVKKTLLFHRMITIYSVVILTSFVVFLFNFFISKNYNYLNYSLYLFFVSLLLIVRIPYFYNELNNIHPKLFYYLRIISITISSALYFYFIISFLNFKNRFSKVYKISLITFKSIVIFTLVYVLLLVLFPYLPYRFLIIFSFKIIFALLVNIVFVFLLFQKGDIIFKTVLISVLLMIIGNALAIITADASYFFNIVLIEIIIFYSIVNYSNSLNFKEKIRVEFELEQEKNEKKNLLALDKAKSNFFTNISHEFRTPLTLISGPLQSKLQKEDLKEEDKATFKMMYRNSTRLLSLVDQLLDISKIEAGSMQLKVSKGNAISFIGTLFDSFTFEAQQKEINYLVYNNPTNTITYFDADVIEKIVVNLLSNAIKYTPEKGSVIGNAKVIKDELHFEVKNTGKGLSKEEIATIFERFYQINENTQGIGIGLALVKELTTLHKGSLKVESEPNGWTSFAVILPIAKERFKNSEIITVISNEVANTNSTNDDSTLQEQNRSSTEANTITTHENPILLVVDDNVDVRDYLFSIFKEQYTIISAKNGQEGIDLAIEHIPDIIISDIMMPIKNGIDLCNTLKVDERTSHVPIILLTAKAGEENEIEGITTGADDYITKPFNEELLKLRVEKLIESRKKLQHRYSQEVVLRPKDIAITPVDEQFLERLQNVLDTKLIESSFSIEDFGKALGMSRMQLHRKLKALTGLSASEFIRSQRLKLAAQLLKKSEIKVSQVGYSVGFNDHAYFSKCFKDMYHCTPTEYVKASQNNN